MTSVRRFCTPLLALLLVLLGSQGVEAFFPTAPFTSGLSRGNALYMSKWVKDNSIFTDVAELVKKYQERKHQMTDSSQRYIEDGIEAIKRHSHVEALEAFDKAFDMNNETGLVWHRGAMLYYQGRYDEAVTYLDKCINRYENFYEEPATEEAVWRAAALMRIHGPDAYTSHVPESKFGGERRRLMRLVHEVYRGAVEPEIIVELMDIHRENPYTNYDLYGNFYLGLYHDAAGEVVKGLGYMEKAMKAERARAMDVMYHYPRLHTLIRGGEKGLL